MAATAIHPDQDSRAPRGGTVLVLGMGGTGAACARYLAARGEQAVFADTRVTPPGVAAIRAAMPTAELLPGRAPVEVPSGVTRILVSPGVDLELPVLKAARSQGLPILSDIDLFVAEARAPIVAITGSNGKSTVTSMLGQMLATAGRRVRVGGNLGTPALDLLDPAAQVYVLELSSFQLERSRLVPCAAAVLLNVSPDHLDIHGDMPAYTAAKARVYEACRVAVVNRDAPELQQLVPAGTPAIGFGLSAPGVGDFGLAIRPDGTWLARGKDLLLPAADLGVTGRHNLSNALAALALGAALGVEVSALLPGLKGFVPLPHRMAIVATARGITWIDDSKATNVGAAVASIGSVDGPLVLIAGGDGKGATFEALAAALRDRPSAAVLLGRDRQQLAKDLAGVCPVYLVSDMEAAVSQALGLAAPGWTVLLAPACSSLDMYRDYGARGDAFRAAVVAATGGPK
jgi:UDP-N-acetylmuramoylalanine--D-glutamate ligase